MGGGVNSVMGPTLKPCVGPGGVKVRDPCPSATPLWVKPLLDIFVWGAPGQDLACHHTNPVYRSKNIFGHTTHPIHGGYVVGYGHLPCPGAPQMKMSGSGFTSSGVKVHGWR